MLNKIKEFGIAKTIVATITGAYIGIYALNYINAPSPCIGICASDYNAVLSSKGFVGKQITDKSKRVYLVDYNEGFSVGSAEVFANKVDRIVTSARKGDLVFIRLTSGGGATVSCSHSYNQINKMKAYGLNVVTSIDYIAASCGYMLASASDEIVASAGSQVGNIGAVMTYQDGYVDLARKFVGGKKKLFGSTRIKELMAGDEPKSEEDYETLRAVAKDHALQFNKRVLKSRGNKIDVKDYEEVFSAKLFYAERAKELGLVDYIGDQRSYLQLLHLTGNNIIHVVNVVPKQSLISKIF